MGGLAPWHLLVIAAVGLMLFFGWKQMPDMARSLGRSLRVFKTEIKGLTEDDKAREAAKEPDVAEPVKQLQARQIVTPARAEVIRNPAARPTPAPSAERARPRPAPSPNGRAQ